LSPIPPSSPPQPTRRGSQSSLPPSSPPAPFSDTDDSLDDRDAIRDVDDNDAEEDADGEDLFGETLQEYVLCVQTDAATDKRYFAEITLRMKF